MTDSTFLNVAQSLDNRRLGKQRVEAFQILNTLSGKSNGWANHPATRMWQGYEFALANYGYTICDEWKSRGFHDSLQEKFHEALGLYRDQETKKPWWVWEPLLHLTHNQISYAKNHNGISGQFQTTFPTSGHTQLTTSLSWEQ